MARWKKPPTGRLTEHFSWFEAVCRHCGRIPDEGTVRETAAFMERVRERLGGFPCHVSSWCRCDPHNKAIGGATGSLHVEGKAVDFIPRGLPLAEAQRRCKTLQKEGLIGGLGIYSRASGRGWIHADTGPQRIWRG